MTAAGASEPGNLSKPDFLGAGERGENLIKPQIFAGAARFVGTWENLGFSERGTP